MNDYDIFMQSMEADYHHDTVHFDRMRVDEFMKLGLKGPLRKYGKKKFFKRRRKRG